jgi:hypothetical protein
LLLSQCGLDAKGIAASIVGRFGPQVVPGPASLPVVEVAKPAA